MKSLHCNSKWNLKMMLLNGISGVLLCFNVVDASELRKKDAKGMANPRTRAVSESSTESQCAGLPGNSVYSLISNTPEQQIEKMLELVLSDTIMRESCLKAKLLDDSLSPEERDETFQKVRKVAEAKKNFTERLFIIRRTIFKKYPEFFFNKGDDPRLNRLRGAIREIIVTDSTDKETLELQRELLLHFFSKDGITPTVIADVVGVLERYLRKHPEKNFLIGLTREADRALEETDVDGFARSHRALCGMIALVEQNHKDFPLERLSNYCLEETKRLLEECEILIPQTTLSMDSRALENLLYIRKELNDILAFLNSKNFDLQTLKRRIYLTFFNQNSPDAIVTEKSYTEFDLAHVMMDDIKAMIQTKTTSPSH